MTFSISLSELPKMINVMKERDDVDVIIASYEGRKHNLIRCSGTKLSVWATSKMLGKDPNLQITSYRLIRRFLVVPAEDQYISSADRKSFWF